MLSPEALPFGPARPGCSAVWAQTHDVWTLARNHRNGSCITHNPFDALLERFAGYYM